MIHFFDSFYLPIGVNATAITLISKRAGVERISDYRPISYSNVVYKCITKLLSDRLQAWLPCFVSGIQYAFVTGRPFLIISFYVRSWWGVII